MAQDRIDPNSISWSGPAAAKESQDLRKGEATIGSAQASAASSAASADRTRTLTPLQAKKEVALTNVAELNAQKIKMALEKSQRLLDGRPAPENLRAMQEDLLYKLGLMAQALQLSRESPTATGFGSGIVSKVGDTSAASVAEIMKTIGGTEAFKKLQQMRAESPTGAAVGNVTEKELDLLASSSAAIGTSSDQTFQEGIKQLMGQTINTLNKLGADPAEIASKVSKEDLPEFSDKIQSYRLLPGDVKKIGAYVDSARKSGTYDPSDYAALMSEAYFNATGRKPDEAYITGALQTGAKLAEDPNVETRKRVLGSDVQKPEAERSWGSTALDAGFNLVPSTVNLAVDTVKALTVDLPDTIEGIVKVIGGATGLSDDTETWDALKEYYAGRYGSVEGFKKALATDPAAILADIAGLATGGATVVAKTAGVAAKVSKISALSEAARAAESFGKVAAKLDPISGPIGLAGQTKVGGKVATATGNAMLAVPAKIAGVTTTDIKQAADAGRRGSTEFLDQLEGRGNVMQPLEVAQKAVTELYQARSRDYTRRMAKMNKTEQLDWADVEDAITAVENVGKHKGIDISSASDVWQEVFDLADQFRAQGLNTIEDFDAMKRGISTLAGKYQLGTPQNKVARDVAKAINNVIVQKAPVYANIMSDYRMASDTLADITASASLGAKSADTALNKLQRTAAGRGPRGRTVLDLLESTKSGKGLGDMLAGQNMSAREAEGFGASVAGPAAIVTGDPSALSTAMITPHALGSKAYALGKAYGYPERAMQNLRATGPGQAVEARAATLAAKYGAPAGAALRMANPVIQAQQDPFVAPAQGQVVNEALADLRKRYQTPARAVLGDPRRVTLGSLPSASPSSGISLSGISLDEEPLPEEEPPVVEYARGGRVMAPIIGG
jgi:hypothetical protein